MCSGKCALCIAGALYPLVLLSIGCNTVLFFPGWDVKYVKEGHLTDEVNYLGGIIGGGFVMLIPTLHIQLTGEQSCCANRFGMFMSTVFAAVGVLAGLYSFVVALVALSHGPLCKHNDEWTMPFKNKSFRYLAERDTWKDCSEPQNVVAFNTGLFFTLLATSCVQMLLCLIQVINGLTGCLFGTCNK